MLTQRYVLTMRVLIQAMFVLGRGGLSVAAPMTGSEMAAVVGQEGWKEAPDGLCMPDGCQDDHLKLEPLHTNAKAVDGGWAAFFAIVECPKCGVAKYYEADCPDGTIQEQGWYGTYRLFKGHTLIQPSDECPYD